MTSPFWDGRRVLVTGHTGFKGAWLALWLQRLGASVAGVSLPPERPSEAFAAMAPWDGLDEAHVDLRDRVATEAAVKRFEPEVVLHLAAQALVRRGYRDPVATYETNVMGTVHLLRAVEATPSVRAVVVVTSDKVYANDGVGRPFAEGDPLGHTDPYSNSKACTELVTAAWRASFLEGLDVAVATARAGNVVGGGDEAEDRLLPDVRRALEAGEPVLLRNPSAVRPWQHVLEPLSGYLALAEGLVGRRPATPPAVNFGPRQESCETVSRVVERVLDLWGGGRWEHAHGDQPPEASLLQLDSSLAHRALGWQPRLDLDQTLRWTVAWWREQAVGGDMRRFSLSQIAQYEELMRRQP